MLVIHLRRKIAGMDDKVRTGDLLEELDSEESVRLRNNIDALGTPFLNLHGGPFSLYSRFSLQVQRLLEGNDPAA